MKTIKIDKYYKGMIAHRGLSGIETENTVFSYLAAANHSYCGISCDLFLSKDEKLILTAETSLLKFGLLNLDIQSFDYEELVKYSLVDRKTENINHFLYIPLLRDFLSICKAYEKTSIIRLHPSLKNINLDMMLKKISEYYDINHCLFISEDKKQIEYLLESVPANQIFFHHLELNQINDEFSNKHKVNIYLDKKNIDKEFVKKCHLIGLKVMTGQVDDKETAEKIVKLDIDYIQTSILE
ncbi:hypothetical protein HF295_03775 [Hujiaoplasma nucleasis]|uniref:GP-PDE domain-containing protein n=1 Tax=Hujiaoplasma nucleasis TaxID=2725268 RepID=A0A7L6N1I9_9MOLU|nr:glycerophosphodiester phosphodiesterase family protein [Hujiaoplasma nucleasis]QLY40023.1 hypothetical protein HF295_03775 [Hujiaoplasma nucleasis]